MRSQDHPNHAPGVPMLMPPWLESLQIRYFNPLMRPLAGSVPGLSVVHHRGRSSGAPYETVVSAFVVDHLVVVGLIHSKTNWVKNVLAAGQADMRVNRRDLHVVNPRVIDRGDEDPALPARVRRMARRAGVFIADVG